MFPIFDAIEQAPMDASIYLIIRHAHRHPIKFPFMGDDVRLTSKGEEDSIIFGRLAVKLRPPGRLETSPVPRCVETLRRIIQGAGWKKEVTINRRLYHQQSKMQYHDLLLPKKFRILPGITTATIKELLERDRDEPKVHIHITHDTVIVQMLEYLFDQPVRRQQWPDYLDGFILWRSGDQVLAGWHGKVRWIPDL